MVIIKIYQYHIIKTKIFKGMQNNTDYYLIASLNRFMFIIYDQYETNIEKLIIL